MNTKTFITDTDDPVDICMDAVFKAVFTRDTPASRGALSKLVSALIGREVTINEILANELPVDNTSDRQVRLDINCEAETGELVNVEMCLNPAPFEPVRMEFHVGKLFTGQDIKGQDKYYSDLNQTYQIAILVKRNSFNDKVFFHTFEYFDPAHNIPLGGRTRIITLELLKLGKTVNKSVRKMSVPELWAFFFRHLTDRGKRSKINEIIACEEGIAMASEVLMNISRSKEERARLLRAEKEILDHQSWMVHAHRTGVAEGLQKGHAEERKRLLALLKSGKSPEEIIREFSN